MRTATRWHAPRRETPHQLPCSTCAMAAGVFMRPESEWPQSSVVAEWDQPQSFADPSTIYRLSCGHQVM